MKYTILFLLLCLPCLVGWGHRSVTVAVDSEPPVGTYLFSWDMETATALLDSGNGSVVGVVNSDAELNSADGIYVSPNTSLKIPSGYDRYTFTDSTAFNPNVGVLTFYIYGNSDDYGDSSVRFFRVTSSGTDEMYIYSGASGQLTAFWGLTSGNMYMTIFDALQPAQWNKCVLTWNNTSGSTVWDWDINNGDYIESGVDVGTWDSGSTIVDVNVGNTNDSTTPLSPYYIDDVRIE